MNNNYNGKHTSNYRHRKNSSGAALKVVGATLGLAAVASGIASCNNTATVSHTFNEESNSNNRDDSFISSILSKFSHEKEQVEENIIEVVVEDLPTLEEEKVTYPEDLHHLDKIAYEICFTTNRWGNGIDRVNALARAGYTEPGCDAEAIQKRINQILDGASYDINNPDIVYYRYVDFFDRTSVNEDLYIINQNINMDEDILKFVNNDTLVYILDNNGHVVEKTCVDAFQLFTSNGKVILNNGVEYDYIDWSDQEVALIPSNNLTNFSEAIKISGTGYGMVEDKSDYTFTLYDSNGNIVLESQVWHGEELTKPTFSHIHTKVDITDMYGSYGVAKDVKYVMYYSYDANGNPVNIFAFHAGNPGVSHGCSRLQESIAKTVYELTSVGTPILIKE